MITGTAQFRFQLVVAFHLYLISVKPNSIHCFLLIFGAKFKISGHFCKNIDLLISEYIFFPEWPLIFEFCAKYQQKAQILMDIYGKKSLISGTRKTKRLADRRVC